MSYFFPRLRRWTASDLSFFPKNRWRIRALSIFGTLNLASILFSDPTLLCFAFLLGSISNVQTRTLCILRPNYLVFVTPVSCIFFETSSNSNLLERRPITHKNVLVDINIALNSITMVWNYRGRHIYLTSNDLYSVLLDVFLFFRLTLWLSLFPCQIIF